MYNLIEYSHNCSKTSGSLWQYYRDELLLSFLLVVSTVFRLNLKTKQARRAGNDDK